MTTINGERWHLWACSYSFEGAQYGFTIMARTEEEARARFERIKTWGRFDGGPVVEVPAFPGAGLYAAFRCWLANRFGIAP